MLAYESKTTIAASRDHIWDVIVDVGRWHEWTPTISRIEAIDAAPMGLGARFKVWQPKLRPAVWTVTDFRPAHGFTWESRFRGARIGAEHWIYPAERDGFDVSLRVRFGGILGVAIGTFSGRLTRSYLATEAAALKRRVETVE